MKYSIIHAERDFRFHKRLKTAFANYPTFQFIDHCCYLDSALPLLNTHQPGLLITASKLYDDTNVVEALCKHRDTHMPDLKIVVLTSKEDMDHFLISVVAGVDAYISKASTVEEIYSCLEAVVRGEHYLGVQKGVINHDSNE